MTSHPWIRTAAVASLCALAGVGTRAESLASSASSAGSSASSAGSASSGSVSDSLNNSSKSSTRTTTTADGDYRVIEVTDVAERPTMLRLTLRAAEDDPAFTLTLPRQALGPRGIASGDVVQVRNRDYGLEFARDNGAGAREAFFLVLVDDWRRQLEAHPVTL